MVSRIPSHTKTVQAVQVHIRNEERVRVCMRAGGEKRDGAGVISQYEQRRVTEPGGRGGRLNRMCSQIESEINPNRIRTAK